MMMMSVVYLRWIFAIIFVIVVHVWTDQSDSAMAFQSNMQSSTSTSSLTSSSSSTSYQSQQQQGESLSLFRPLNKITSSSSSSSSSTTQLFENGNNNNDGGGGWLDGIGSFMKRFTTRADASHILLKGTGIQLMDQLETMKEEIDNSPIKFAEYAMKYSQCPSNRSGGSLGEFGPGTMVKEFDDVVFATDNDIGNVYGPIRTQFGYHLIYIHSRTD